MLWIPKKLLQAQSRQTRIWIPSSLLHPHYNDTKQGGPSQRRHRPTHRSKPKPRPQKKPKPPQPRYEWRPKMPSSTASTSSMVALSSRKCSKKIWVPKDPQSPLLETMRLHATTPNHGSPESKTPEHLSLPQDACFSHEPLQSNQQRAPIV